MMLGLKGLGRREASTSESETAKSASEQVGEEAQAWTGGSMFSARAATVLLWALVLTGPGYALYDQVLEPAPEPAIEAVSENALEPDSVLASGHAVEVVHAWLSASSSDSDQAMALLGGLESSRFPDVAPTVLQTAVAHVEQAQPGVWAVVVSARVQEIPGEPAEGEEESAPGERLLHARVAVAVDSESAVPQVHVISLPSLVAAPEVTAPPRSAYRRPMPVDAAPAQAAAGFLAAMLTGEGDVSRYVTPGADLAPLSADSVDEVAMTSVASMDEVTNLDSPADGQVLHLLATAVVGLADGSGMQTSYPLELTARDGRWEVTSIHPTPLQENPAATTQEES